MTIADENFEQARQLPEPLARDALDFVLFLRTRHQRRDWRDLIDARSSALAGTRDNDRDEAWNHV
jgi:hypothetical protein